MFWKDPGQEMVGRLSCPGNLTDHHAGPDGIFIPEENTPAFEQIHCRAGLAPEPWRAPLAGQGPSEPPLEALALDAHHHSAVVVTVTPALGSHSFGNWLFSHKL